MNETQIKILESKLTDLLNKIDRVMSASKDKTLSEEARKHFVRNLKNLVSELNGIDYVLSVLGYHRDWDDTKGVNGEAVILITKNTKNF